jgi:hypothetical protein
MCFSASAVIDSLTVNGLLLVVEAFGVFSYKEMQIVNVTTLIIVKM